MNQISPLAFVHPEAKLGDNNIIGPFCYIDKNTVIGDNNVFQNSVTIHIGARLGNNNEIFPGASISTKPQDLKFKNEESICEIGDNNSIRENVTISRGTASKGVTKVGNNNLLMECVHVAHDCVIGSGDIIGNATKFAGEVTVDDNAIISANILCHQFCHIGGYVMVQGGSRFRSNSCNTPWLRPPNLSPKFTVWTTCAIPFPPPALPAHVPSSVQPDCFVPDCVMP